MVESSETHNADPRLSEIAPGFLAYAEVELGMAKQSLVKYRECLGHICRMIGDRPISSYIKEDLFRLKQAMLAKNHSVSRQVSFLATFKRILRYASEEHGLATMDPGLITFPRRPRRDVVYLTTEEISRFINAIALTTKEGEISVRAVRFRALVEALLGSAMRIGELLSLDRANIDFENREARIVGKGNKQRTVFFTDRAIAWLETYLHLRHDDHPALFVSRVGGSRMARADTWRPFVRYRGLAQIEKRLTPHMLRHTAATHLLFNGCPVGHIKEILGHERLETTCRYYLGLDNRAAKKAHSEYLVYAEPEVDRARV